MILKPIALDERASLQLKVLAADALKSRRKDWGVSRKWEGDYLTKVNGLLRIMRTGKVLGNFQDLCIESWNHTAKERR